MIERNIVYSCPYCSQEFYDKVDFEEHKKVCTGKILKT